MSTTISKSKKFNTDLFGPPIFLKPARQVTYEELNAAVAKNNRKLKELNKNNNDRHDATQKAVAGLREQMSELKRMVKEVGCRVYSS